LPDHADDLFPLVYETPVVETLVWDGPSSVEALRESLRERAANMARGKVHAYAVLHHGKAVGTIALRPVLGDYRSDIGLWIGTPSQGRGLGTFAIGEVSRLAFMDLGHEKVEASVFVGNVASRRAFENNGFRLEGTIRCAVRKANRLVDEWLLGITRQDYLAR
jgi:RimJ/RimL family protein N-acetyltransferase